MPRASHRRGMPMYAYAHAMARPMRRRLWMWIFYAPIVAFVLYAFLHGLMGQTPLGRDYDTSILLEDRAGCLTETAELRDSMERFVTKTGITPAVITVTDESWKTRYNSLELYAYDLYVNSFDDERHWLIVYSQPEAGDDEFTDWSWEGMQGEETDSLLTKSRSRAFGKTLQKGLTRGDTSVSAALCEAFDSTAEQMMSPTLDNANSVLFFLAFVAVVVLVALRRTGTLLPRAARGSPTHGTVTRPETAAAQQPAPAQVCAYCGSAFPEGSVKCPNCGASRPAS